MSANTRADILVILFVNQRPRQRYIRKFWRNGEEVIRMEIKILIYGWQTDSCESCGASNTFIHHACDSTSKGHTGKDRQEMQRFLWAHRENKTHHLHLKMCDAICTPKSGGGLGLRKMADTNKAFITKLAWNVTTEKNKTWVKLIRAKYLGDRQILDVQRSTSTMSWIWGNILQSINTLRDGACYQLGAHSTLKVKGSLATVELRF